MNSGIGWAGINGLGSVLSDKELREWRSLPALQQPDWGGDWLLDEVTRDLAGLPELVGDEEVSVLRSLLAGVAHGHRQVIQAGDCAEDPASCHPDALSRRVGLLDALAGAMRMASGLPVIRVGRIAGQFAKPRSSPVELANGIELPVFRGHMINGPKATAEDRRPDPLRLLSCHEAAQAAMAYLREQHDRAGGPVWTSHEALILDYELPQLRPGADGQLMLTSTHWPWIGDRTRGLDGAHVRLLAMVSNPVACKVGPTMSEDELAALCGTLDPRRTPGRLTLITRMGASTAAERLPRLASRVRAEGHPVIWLCDPMHGNTVRAADGRKTRLLTAMVREIGEFLTALDEAGVVAGGLHLEATPEPVTECVLDESQLDGWDGSSTTLCDPRLNAQQALLAVGAWR